MVLVRLFWFIVVLVVGFYNAVPFITLLEDNLGYKEMCDGLFCLEGFETGFLALMLSYSLWLGIVFGALGKKVDYILIGIVFLLTFFLFTQEGGKTWEMFVGLVAITALGNAIGFGLKQFFK